ncbi:hypothetical protein [Deinococcus roseus]|uniref:AraC family transcriptional regulator n=1 Tax=Deinococcus roseus TaxID=392414 RepID=A0ABQ2CTJ7_9DEIO|nr:hypothetical protein [Deinococcus roseus]GGJ19732.1 hypothetical protein GCM10008938_02320 [Deinococcus roseus]
MDFIQRTRRFSPALADHLQQVAQQTLDFSGLHPLDHSRHNHVHLWKLEYEADLHPEINLQYRVDCARFVQQSWTEQLKFHPKGAYLFYLYEDLAPTVSVVRETEYEFPYAGTPVFVEDMAGVMRLYVGRSWKAQFKGNRLDRHVLEQLEKHQGSLTRTAQHLNLSIAELRRWIEQLQLTAEVNALRKHFYRRSLQLKTEWELPLTYRIYHKRIQRD